MPENRRPGKKPADPTAKATRSSASRASSKKKSSPSTASKSPEVLPAEREAKRGYLPARGREYYPPEESEETGRSLEDSEDEGSEDADEPSEDQISEAASEEADPRALVPEIQEREISAISPTDPLRRYLDEVRHHPLLDPEEEFRLALKLRDEGDLNAAKRLVQANLRLVVKIAFEYKSYYSNLMDLIQEGNIGLMKAVSKFDPTKGARLGYYASWWIRSYILKYLLDNFRLVKIGTTQAQKKLFYHLLREKERLEAQGLLAGPKLLAEKLDVREKDVIEMEQRLSGRGSEMSLDAPVNTEEGSGPSFVDYLVDQAEGAEERLAREQLLKLLADRLPEFEKTLGEKELRLLRDRLLAEEPKTLQEVADLYGLTRERARQIEAKVILKLRDFLKPSLGSLNDLNDSED